MLAFSSTGTGIGLPRTFSASAQKMWPPSSGRNGKRLMIARLSEISAMIWIVRSVLVSIAVRGALVAAGDARDLLALLSDRRAAPAARRSAS